MTEDGLPLRERVRANPGAAVLWLAGVAVLVALEFGALASTVMDLPWNALVELLPAAPGAALLSSVGDALAGLPTLLSRETIPNQGYKIPGEGWKNTFLGLSSGVAWLVRAVLIYAYAFAWVAWGWQGYRIYRREYRYADWTPRDDMVDRFRSHRWGQFGLVVVFVFVVMAVFAPALGTTTVDRNITNPYGHQVTYYDEAAQDVVEVPVGMANLQTASQGNKDANFGLLSYDKFGRFHPFGTLPSGKDLFTYLVAGARVTLFIGLVSIAMAGGIASILALVSAYYKGVVDLATILVSDSIMSLPVILLLILLSVLLDKTWIAEIYNGAMVLVLIFSLTWWPYLWRTIRGPTFQVSERNWIDAARSFGQRPRITMQKHMLPYVIGYMMVYASMSLGGIIISIAGLSYLGLGLHGIPEWGQAINAGQSYVTTASWHISFIPGVLIVLIVTGFNALGDGIRDAIDPHSETGSEGSTEAETAATGGGA